MVATCEAQTILAVLVCLCGNLRWPMKVALVLGLAGCALANNFLAFMDTLYPYVEFKDYLIPLPVAAAVGCESRWPFPARGS